jgi:aldehyde dehydrogenase (NAD(P)+)
LQTEVFAPVLGVLELPGAGQSFLDRAVSTVNDEVMGTLNVHLIAHPRTVAELDGFEDAIARLRYGCVAVNVYAGVSTMAAVASWGAFAGHTLDDIQSGIGVVHNALLLENPERTVVRGPFRPSPRSLLHGERTIAPRPPWFVTNRTAAGTGRALAEFAARPGWARLPKVLASAVRG